MKSIFVLLVLGMLLAGCAQYDTTPSPNGTGNTGPGSGGGGAQTGSGGTTAAGSVTVHISNFAFVPAEITIRQGTTVTWVNDDSVPHLIRMSGKPDSQQLGKGDTYSYTFTDAPGEYDYSCGIHPSMHGKVMVTG